MTSVEKAFKPFSSLHWAAMAVILGTALFYVFIARHPKCRRWVRPMSVLLATVLLGNEIVFIGGAMVKGLWSPVWGLPLQLCDLAIFAVAYSLFRYTPWVWELAYFWGLGGTMQAVLTPDLRVTFPEYYYFKFFLTHGCILTGVIFCSAGLRRPITVRSVVRVWVITNGYAALIAVVDLLFKANYLYLCRKPSQPSLLDYFGPWPWYLPGLEFLLVVSLFIYYLPYRFAARSRRGCISGAGKVSDNSAPGGQFDE